MFETLSNGFNAVFRRLRQRGVISAQDLDNALRDIRVLLLESDVSLSIVKQFTQAIRDQLAQKDIARSTQPERILFTIAYDQLLAILRQSQTPFSLPSQGKIRLLLLGLQGVGKTTSCIKLARFIINKHNKKVGVVSLDGHRPAAREQLAILARQAHIPILIEQSTEKAIDIARRALREADDSGLDVILFDSAGRAECDDAMMAEIEQINQLLKPDKTLIVTDATFGQSALETLKSFQSRLKVDAGIVTRLDGDARAGVILSMVSENCPVQFVGVGESVNDLEIFDPARLATRIMGQVPQQDVMEALKAVTDDVSIQHKTSSSFTLEDLYDQLEAMEKAGGLAKFASLFAAKMPPQMLKKGLNIKGEEKAVKKQKAIILSMTTSERRRPMMIKASRKQRIAKGSGSTIQEVNRLLKQHQQAVRMMKKMGKRGSPFTRS